MKYRVKNNVFAMGRLNKAGTVIDVEPELEKYYKGHIEPIEKKVKNSGTNRRRKKNTKDNYDSV